MILIYMTFSLQADIAFHSQVVIINAEESYQHSFFSSILIGYRRT